MQTISTWFALLWGTLALAAASAAPAGTAAVDRPVSIDTIDKFRRETWRWQSLMGRRRTASAYSARHTSGHAYRRWVLALWRQRAVRARAQAQRPPHRSAWLCLQRYEGHWRSYPGGPGVLNSGGPYYGGLQMDLSFQRRYGGYLLRRKGTANRWSRLEQMWVAERAHRERGFTPWPNTARTCGLL